MSITLDTKRIPYDTLKPDENLTDFLSFCRDVKMRYEGNARETEEKEDELQDLEHWAELHDDLDCKGGYAIYKKIREARRDRRKCKSENELLYPLYDWVNKNEKALNALAQVLGRVRETADVIDNRKYTARTNVLGDG